MKKFEKVYIINIAIALIYIVIGWTGWTFMKGQNYLMLVLMLLSFFGLSINIIKSDYYAWNGEGKIMSLFTWIMIMAFARIGSVDYYIEGTKYLGGILSLLLLIMFLYEFISNTERKGKPIVYIMIIVLIICIVFTAYNTIIAPKSQIRFLVEQW